MLSIFRSTQKTHQSLATACSSCKAVVLPHRLLSVPIAREAMKLLSSKLDQTRLDRRVLSLEASGNAGGFSCEEMFDVI